MLPLKINGVYAKKAHIPYYNYMYNPKTMCVYREVGQIVKSKQTDDNNVVAATIISTSESESKIEVDESGKVDKLEFVGVLQKLNEPKLHIYASAYIDSDFYMILNGTTDAISTNTIKFKQSLWSRALANLTGDTIMIVEPGLEPAPIGRSGPIGKTIPIEPFNSDCLIL